MEEVDGLRVEIVSKVSDSLAKVPTRSVELLGLIGMPGVCILREDDCTTAGTPYQKARAWFSTCWGIASKMASVCNHPLPHPERLEGSKTSLSAIYPPEVATKYVEGVVSKLQNFGRLTSEEARDSLKLYLENIEPFTDSPKVFFTGPFVDWVERGRFKIEQVRHGQTVSESKGPEAPPILEAPGRPLAAFGRSWKWTSPKSPGDFERVALTTPAGRP